MCWLWYQNNRKRKGGVMLRKGHVKINIIEIMVVALVLAILIVGLLKAKNVCGESALGNFTIETIMESEVGIGARVGNVTVGNTTVGWRVE